MQNKLTVENLPFLLTIVEVASLFKVSTKTIRRWDKKGKLQAIRINPLGHRRFKREEIFKYINN